MTHFSLYPGHCKVERFKVSGKWYDTFVIDMTDFYNETDIHEAVKAAILKATNGRFSLDDFIYVCLEPYHRNAYPIMLKK